MLAQKKKAFQIIFIFGLISLFGDIIYEGARSVNGPYLKTLGANAAVVGIIAGLGELLGYAIRLVSGYFSDKTKAYWFFVFIGYAMLISVPLLSLTGAWQIASFLIVAERIGKAMRSPARDTIVSQAAKQVGTGLGFGINEAMDQIGAITGPLIFAGLFLFTGAFNKTVHDYQRGYKILWLPFIFLLLLLFIAYKREPNPQQLEEQVSKKIDGGNFSKVFWLYTAFSFVTTLGLVNFLILGYHFKTKNIFSDAFIPLIYAIAMGIDAIAALTIGKTYDVLKQKNNSELAGLSTLVVIPIFSIFIALFAFSKIFIAVIASMILWGVLMGAHETIMKSAIADLTPLKKRGTAYGIFNAGYGIALFAGSAIMGALYENYLSILVAGVVGIEIIALILFFAMRKEAALKNP